MSIDMKSSRFHQEYSIITLGRPIGPDVQLGVEILSSCASLKNSSRLTC